VVLDCDSGLAMYDFSVIFALLAALSNSATGDCSSSPWIIVRCNTWVVVDGRFGALKLFEFYSCACVTNVCKHCTNMLLRTKR
jgi:hypothetical protein